MVVGVVDEMVVVYSDYSDNYYIVANVVVEMIVVHIVVDVDDSDEYLIEVDSY